MLLRRQSRRPSIPVLVKTRAALASELALADQLLEQPGRPVALLPGVVEEARSDRGRHVQTNEIEEPQRAHRVARPELHARVDVGGGHARSLEQANGVE